MQATISISMVQKIRLSVQWTVLILIGACLLTLVLFVRPSSALTPIPEPKPKPGSYGLEATKTQPPPERGATITTPGNGASFSTSPITVSGICPNELLVQVYNNGVMVGAVMCTGGSFSLEVGLFAGTNELTAIVYDDLEQAGPESNVVTVNYTDTSFEAFGELVTLTSSYGRRAAPAGNQLTWPLQISGGTGPYALSIDWGDGTPTQLKSQPLGGVVGIDHIYKRAGLYQVNIQATDVNGVSAFLQVVAVSSGQVEAAADNTPGGQNTTVMNKVLWMPAAASLVMLPLAFWLGRRSQLVSLKNKMQRERDSYEQ